MTFSWIPTSAILDMIHVQGILTIILFAVIGNIFYRFFLKEISAKRHLKMQMRFRFLLLLCLFTFASLVLSYAWIELGWLKNFLNLTPIFSLIALLFFAISLIRLAHYYVYLMLFSTNMRSGVPRLIANVFTLLFAFIVVAWLASSLFGFKLATVLATSAVFSLVLGLALQDTLGNFFSGVSLQFDHSFGLGDWIEVQSGSSKWTGQVHEINWRATSLIGFADELISIPNKVLANSQVTLFSQNEVAPRRSLAFRFSLDSDLEMVKNILMNCLMSGDHVLQSPEPRVLVIDTTDSWILVKCFYSISDFGIQYRISDQLICQILKSLKENNISLANQVYKINQPSVDKLNLI